MRLHRPCFYRYRVGHPGFRFVMNRYGWSVIGAAFVVSDTAYCVKWAWS